jgi:hypothetical protein
MGVDFPEVGVFPLSDIWEGFPMALTDTEIRRSKPGDKPFKLSDGGGLHLMVTPSGGKLWRWAAIPKSRWPTPANAATRPESN